LEKIIQGDLGIFSVPKTVNDKLQVNLSHSNIALAHRDINLFLLTGVKKIVLVAKKVNGTVNNNIPS